MKLKRNYEFNKKQKYCLRHANSKENENKQTNNTNTKTTELNYFDVLFYELKIMNEYASL